MHDDSGELLFNVFAVMGLIALVVWCVSSSCDERARQSTIRERCVPVRHISGDTVIVATGKDFGVGFTPDKTCYRCPDGFEECF